MLIFYLVLQLLFVLRSSFGYLLPQILTAIILVYLCILAPNFWEGQLSVFDSINIQNNINVAASQIGIFIFLISFTLLLIDFSSLKLFRRKPILATRMHSRVIDIYSSIVSANLLLSIFGLFPESLKLIAYQFTDLSLGLIYYLFRTRRWISLSIIALLYSAYSVYTGYRYKLLYIAILFISIYLSSSQFSTYLRITKSNLFKSLVLTASSFIIVLIFGVLTITRVKNLGEQMPFFSSVLQTLVSSSDIIFSDQIFSLFGYGFFAESNILFGYISSTVYHDYDINILSLLGEVLYTFLPSFLVPFKDNYLVVKDILLTGFSSIDLSANGTAFPALAYFNVYTKGYSFTSLMSSIICFGIILHFLRKFSCFYSRRFALLFNIDFASLSMEVNAILVGILIYLYIFRGLVPELLKFIAIVLIGFYLPILFSKYRRAYTK